VINARGRIDLLPSHDAQLHITALKVVRLGTRENAQKALREMTVVIGTQGDRYRIEGQYPRHHDIRIDFWDLFRSHDGGILPLYEVRITCEVPRGLAVRARETSGDIHSESLSGTQSLESTSGDIDVLAAAAALEAGSTSGDVRVSDVRQARVTSTSGDVS